MSRLDIRSDVDLPVKIALKNCNVTEEEKGRFSNLCLNGGLIECSKTYPEKGVVSLKSELTQNSKLEILGEVLRVEDNKIAIRFCNIRKDEKTNLWNYLKDHLTNIDTCPYCRSENISNAKECDTCGLSLDFDSPQYLSKHERWSFLKRLAMQSEFFSVDDIIRIHNFVDMEILGVGSYNEPDRADSGAGKPFYGSKSSVLNDNLTGITSLKEAKSIIEKQKLLEALKGHNNNISKVAKVLEVSRPSVYTMMKKYGV